MGRLDNKTNANRAQRDIRTSWDLKTRMLLGDEGASRLGNACAMVIGLGGVGGSCALALARAGVGHLVLVDDDVVSPTNLNRQALAFASTLGQPKVEVAASMARDINPQVETYALQRRILADDVEGLLASLKLDFIVDAQDTVSTKIALAECAERLDIRLVSCMGTGNKLHPELFQIADIYKTSVDPLCRVLRHELRARGVAGLTVLFSTEEPIKPQTPANLPEGEDGRVGTVSFVPPAAGLMLAGHVVRTLALG